MKACIIGIGNRWREDDGVGLAAVERLKATIPSGLADIFYLEQRLFELQSCFDCYKKLVIIDALPPGREPGRIRMQRITGPPETAVGIYSLHDLDLLWQIRYAFFSGFRGEVMLIGIEMGSMGYGEGLSLQLKNKLAEVISELEPIVVEFLKDIITVG